MTELTLALSQLLSEPGVIDIRIGPIEDDWSASIAVRYNTQVGIITHLTAVDSLDDLARRLNEIREFELDPR